VLRLRSVKSIVIAPAKTGNDNNKSKAVIKVAQTKRGCLRNKIPGDHVSSIVVLKLIAPKN
jgi:hypothetical protein